MRKQIQEKNIKIEVSTNGAELKSLQCNGTEYIWCSDAKYWKYCAPVLFPVVGKLKDLETVFNGKTYHLNQHGFIRETEFNYMGKINGEYVFENMYSQETLKVFPFKYLFRVKYVINEDSLTTIFEVKNIGKEIMPFALGGHPAINCPLYDGEKFEDYTIYFEKPETFKSPKILSNSTLDFDNPVLGYTDIDKLNLKKDLFVIDTIIITNPKSKSVKLLNKDNKGVEFSFENFSTFAIWTPHNDAPFVCLEPWQGYNDLVDTNKDFLTKPDIVKLQSNEMYRASYTIEIKK